MKVYLDKTIFNFRVGEYNHKDIVFKGWYEVERENCYPTFINIYHEETGKLFQVNNSEIIACKGDFRSNQYYSKFSGKFRWDLTLHDAKLAILAEKDCEHCFWNQWRRISDFKTETTTEMIDDTHRIWRHTTKSVDERRCTYEYNQSKCVLDAEADSLELYIKPCDYVNVNFIRSFEKYVQKQTKSYLLPNSKATYVKNIDTYQLYLNIDTKRIYYFNTKSSFDFPATEAEIKNWNNYRFCLNKKSREKMAEVARDFLFYDKLEEKWNQYVENNKEIFDFINENKL